MATQIIKLSEKYFDKTMYKFGVTPEEIKLYGEIIRKETIQLFWKENTPEYKLLNSELLQIAKENNL